MLQARACGFAGIKEASAAEGRPRELMAPGGEDAEMLGMPNGEATRFARPSRNQGARCEDWSGRLPACPKTFRS
jgi:hypothetical protein